MKTDVVSAATDEREAVRRAVEVLRQGKVVGLPTETVYGLAADALEEKTVAKIFAAKSRPRFDPLIVHLPDPDWVNRVADVPGTCGQIFARLRTEFWPGPLTFVFPRKSIVPDIVTAGFETVALRVSAHRIFSKVIESFGGPIAAPSANRFGRISPTAAAHVVEELDGLIPLIVDGGRTKHGLESTIIALRNDRIEILRRGPVTEEQLVEFGPVAVVAGSSQVEVPGQLPNHYAPKTRLVLVEDAAAFILQPDERCGLLAWQTEGGDGFTEVRQLSEKRDLTEAATNLFRYLRELDSQNLDLIVAERVPDTGLGAAINDRLRRAAQGGKFSKPPSGSVSDVGPVAP
ncbi:MAG: L-threonylcarbamoyladenylate synthase [Chthoniobacterales bacterium]